MTKMLRKKAITKENTTDQLIELLVQSASRELSTYYYYTVLSRSLNGSQGRDIREIVEAAQAKDRKHFEALVERIYDLSDKVPPISTCPPASLPADAQNVQEVLHLLIEEQRRAVRSYNRVCTIAAGRDHGTYLLAQKILNEELEHKAWFSVFLDENPHHCIQVSNAHIYEVKQECDTLEYA